MRREALIGEGCACVPGDLVLCVCCAGARELLSGDIGMERAGYCTVTVALWVDRACVRKYIHTYIHTYKVHTYIQTYTHTHTHKHTYIYIYIYIYIQGVTGGMCPTSGGCSLC